ncbi:hypothetical protein E3N88_40289 [Mikania micrantha]|uniref:SWIM-type domain-containing protein n=1 Tax=Mikania micrantha TaxID=192012 RepID=A0A5N6LM67_9ASTR|nr:hypothetical protein E3N88_40289 [Mikania micrantha]
MSNSNFTFISDRQKGIIPAISKVFPSAEHRYCLRHIHENMRQKWRGEFLKNLLWKCASATTIPKFESMMEEIRKQDSTLFDWLKQIPPKHWARAYFTGARDKPVITCLEYIREYMMKRILVVHKLISKCDGPLTPNATKAFNTIKSEASQYTVIWNTSNKYQVNGPWSDQRVVDVGQRTCSCRRWELTGMPCKHAVAVNWNMAVNGIEVGIPESWVSKVYWLDTWKKVYQSTVNPINGKDLWIPSTCPTTLLPPKHHKQIGRPKKKRKKAVDELNQGVSKNGKMVRAGNTITCTLCKDIGHNKRTCNGQRQNG